MSKLTVTNGMYCLNGMMSDSHAGFPSLTFMVSALKSEGVSVNLGITQNSKSFIDSVNRLFGLELSKGCKIVTELKREGLYLNYKGSIYCEPKLWLLFYSLFSTDGFCEVIRMASERRD